MRSPLSRLSPSPSAYVFLPIPRRAPTQKAPPAPAAPDLLLPPRGAPAAETMRADMGGRATEEAPLTAPRRSRGPAGRLSRPLPPRHREGPQRERERGRSRRRAAPRLPRPRAAAGVGAGRRRRRRGAAGARR